MSTMSAATDSATQEKEKIWKWIETRLWQNTRCGICYERPTVNGRPIFRSLKARNRHARLRNVLMPLANLVNSTSYPANMPTWEALSEPAGLVRASVTTWNQRLSSLAY